MKIISVVVLLSLLAAASAVCTSVTAFTAPNGAGFTAQCSNNALVTVYHVNATGQDLQLDAGTSGTALGSGTAVGTSVSITLTRAYATNGGTGAVGTLEQHGTYYLKDGGDNTFSGPHSTACAILPSRSEAVTPPKFVPTGSGLTQFVDGINPVTPKLTLKFTADRAYNSVAFEFLYNNLRTDSRCGVNFNGATSDNVRSSGFNNHIATGLTGNGAWSYTGFGSAATCGDKATYQYEVNDYNKALTNCGWLIDESNSGVTTMKTTVLMTTLEQGVVIRNVLYKKTLESAVQLGIEFQTNVTATTGNLTIFGPQILYSTIIKQTFEPQNSCANWLLLTSVQGPYQLYPKAGGSFVNPGLSSTPVAGTEHAWTSPVFRYLASDSDITALALSGYTSAYGPDNTGASGTSLPAPAAKCVTNALTPATFSRNDSATVPFTPCNQYWYVRACKGCTSSSFTDVQTLNYNWVATFMVTCHSSFSGSCATTPQNDTVTVSWSTSSDNYCPRIIDTESSTATLTVYQGSNNPDSLPAGPSGSTFNTPQSQFVFGTRSYFEATTTSTIKINDLEIERIGLTAGGASTLTADTDGARLVFKRAAFAATGWWSPNNGVTPYTTSIVSNGVSGGKAVLSDLELAAPDLGVNFLINKNVTTGSDLTRKCQFQWVWGSKISAAQGDFPSTTTIQVDLRVRYQDQNNPKELVLSAKMIPNLQADAGAIASRTVGVQGSTGTTTPVGGGASAEGSAALSTGTIAIGAAAVGGVALIAAATVVAVRRRRKSAEVDTNIESIQLGGGSSQAQLNTV